MSNENLKKKNPLVNFYNKNGYLIIKVFKNEEIKYIHSLIKKKAQNHIKKLNWDLSNYHKFVDANKHKQVINSSTRCISVNKKIIDKIKNNRSIKIILKSRWKHSNFIIPDLNYLNGITKTTSRKNLRKNEILFRIVAPKKISFSLSAPPHLDLNAGKIINRKKEGKTPVSFSLWTPIVGFSKKYTLNFAPGSHLFNHPIGKIENQNKYISRTFDKKYYKKFKFKRLNLKPGECILFDINLLHGGAENLGNKTRVSIETRLYHKNKVRIK